MKTNAVKSLAPNGLLALVLAAGSLFSPLSQAQQVYRIIGPDGKVTFSDQPPPQTTPGKVSAANTGSGGAPASANLPFELRQVAAKYPVTLYSSESCGIGCTNGRSMLMTRGIPFNEKLINTRDDALALQRLSGATTVPLLTIGSQQIKGYSDAEWTQYLNAAGYPQTSVLPGNYRPPLPTPMVTAAPAVPAGEANGAVRPVAAPPLPIAAPPQADNPSGIKF
jgi:glutaredoxin